MESPAVDLEKQRSILERLSLWDSKENPLAGLTESQRDDVSLLSSIISNTRLPGQLEPVSNATPSNQSQLTHKASLRIADELQEATNSDELHELAELRDSLGSSVDECEAMLTAVDAGLVRLSRLSRELAGVTASTTALHDDCDERVRQRGDLAASAESLAQRLSYFNELERLDQRLNSGGLSASSDGFLVALGRIDECVAFLRAHPEYRDSAVYLARFNQCLNKSLGLVKGYVETALVGATDALIKREGEATRSDNAVTLFYGKFRANAPRIKSLMERLERRDGCAAEYRAVLEECRTCYVSQRERLVRPSVVAAMGELASEHRRDHCTMVRTGAVFMVHLSRDEYQLYQHFFTRPCKRLDALLESLCAALYDIFRPMVIRVNHLETLAELCAILKDEMLENYVQRDPEELAALGNVFTQMLEDVQERLVYRTSIYTRTDILGYSPSPGDLAYPDKLLMMESIASSLNNRSNSLDSEGFDSVSMSDSVVGQSSVSPADIHGMWFPTVRRTMVCLSKLYRCLDKSIFQGLSQEALSMCVVSLESASSRLVAERGAVHGRLFLIKHLLILREQISPFKAEFSIGETSIDFSHTASAVRGFWSHKRDGKLLALSSENAFLALLLEGSPQATEVRHDSRKQVDVHLKQSCLRFIDESSVGLVKELRDFVDKAKVIVELKKQGETGVCVKDQPWGSPETIHDLVASTSRNVKTKLPGLLSTMRLYLANKETELVLFRAIRSNVQSVYSDSSRLVTDTYDEESVAIIGCPSVEELNLILSVSLFN